MDEFTIDDRNAPGVGEEFDVELSASLLDDDESWETMFSGNLERRKALEHIDGWSYHDPMAAAAWISEAPAGAGRDAATVGR